MLSRRFDAGAGEHACALPRAFSGINTRTHTLPSRNITSIYDVQQTDTYTDFGTTEGDLRAYEQEDSS